MENQIQNYTEVKKRNDLIIRHLQGFELDSLKSTGSILDIEVIPKCPGLNPLDVDWRKDMLAGLKRAYLRLTPQAWKEAIKILKDETESARKKASDELKEILSREDIKDILEDK